MAALLVRAVLDHGLVLEIYEGGVLYLIDGQRKQEIKLSAAAGLDLLTVLERSRDILEQAAQRSLHELEEVYGRAAEHAEHQRGESITYRSAEGLVRSGIIIWIAAPSRAGGRELPLRYIVDSGDLGMPDICLPADLIEQKDASGGQS